MPATCRSLERNLGSCLLTTVGTNQIPRLSQDPASILIRERLHRDLERLPAALGDALIELRSSRSCRRLEQEQMTVLVNQPPPQPEIPINDLQLTAKDQVIQSRLLGDL